MTDELYYNNRLYTLNNILLEDDNTDSSSNKIDQEFINDMTTEYPSEISVKDYIDKHKKVDSSANTDTSSNMVLTDESNEIANTIISQLK